MKRQWFYISKGEEEELRRMIAEVKINLKLTGIRKNPSTSQVIKFILFERRKR